MFALLHYSTLLCIWAVLSLAQLWPIIQPRLYGVKRLVWAQLAQIGPTSAHFPSQTLWSKKRPSWAQLAQLRPIFRPRLYGVIRPTWTMTIPTSIVLQAQVQWQCQYQLFSLAIPMAMSISIPINNTTNGNLNGNGNPFASVAAISTKKTLAFI